MKLLLVGILLLASVAYLKAEVDEDEIEESMPLDDVDLTAEEDAGLIKCKAEKMKCLKDAGKNFKKRLECFMNYRKCAHNRPTGRPRPSRPHPSHRPRPSRPHPSHRPRPSRPHPSHRPRPSRPHPSHRPRPTRPDYVVKCANDRSQCIKDADV
ncbi:hypothetical protein QZH41_018658 [Actinostola sp. cb2023]|nr:hypothetical protein QZH41_018658 [Actinostola sp. cb2023]